MIYIYIFKELILVNTTEIAQPQPSTQKSARNSSKKKDTPQVKQAIKKKPDQSNDPQPKKKTRGPKQIKKDQQTTKVQPKKGKAGKKIEQQHQTSQESPKTTQSPQNDPSPKPVEQQKQKQLKKAVLKGSIPVDQFFSKPTNYKIYSDSDRTYAATLNQSNIQSNNNKFYIIQLLQHEALSTEFILFTRWGRVGVQGQSSQANVKNKELAIKQYNKKLNEKKKTYKEVQMNYEENSQPEKKQKTQTKKEETPTSTLAQPVQDLIRLIFDMKMMAKQMKQIGYDANKMPLGKLAKSSILKGYSILQEIMTQLKGKNRTEVINKLSGEFFSQIPHNFGFRKMSEFVLKTEAKVKQKLEMLQSLQDIQVFTKLLDEGEQSEAVNQLDCNYQKLSTLITPLDKHSPTYQLLLEYVTNTHASTHTAYKLEVQEIFQLRKEEEISRYKTDIGNKQLLWHGSRLTNFVGILSQGLRIAPPQAPVTGYMFGKGVYFADMVTKSANYCFTSKQNNTGLMLLCEVALGEVNQKFYADYYANLLPEGKHSTKGCGKTAPKEGKMLGDVLVPCGEGAPTGASGSLLYNEFIVYDVGQIKCRYLFRMRFNYK